MKHHLRAGVVGIVVACLAASFVAAGDLPTPPDVWKDYDPDAGDFREEIVREETRDGISSRDSFISAFVLGEEVRVYCHYAVKAGATRAPGLLNVHGWMGAASIDRAYVDDGWAVMSFDYCGKTGDRPRFTKYPEPLKHGNMDRALGGTVHSTAPDGKPITDPRQSSDYLWYAIQRRVLSYLERQPEVDRTRLGAKGYSYGGTLMWNLGTDPRVKAIVAYFGIGWNEYYRSRQVWMYDGRSAAPPKSPGEELFLAAVAPEAHVPFITAATLWLNGSNDHHGGHERSLQSFERFQPGVPWAFAIQARGHHNTEKIDQDAKMWLEKHVLGRDVFWPAQPKSEIRLDAEGVPELVVTPASRDRVTKVEMWYALKDPCSFTRFWRDCPCEARDGGWVGRMPVVNVDDYVFGYGNVTYDTTVVVSSFFNAAIPAKLGAAAKATDGPSAEIAAGDEAALWTNAAHVQGVGGVKGFRPTNNGQGSATESVGDPKWQAPERARLTFRFYCTEPQTLVLSANDAFDAEIEITASDGWQSLTVDPGRLTNRHDKRPLDSWRSVKKIHLKPQAGSDLTRVIFAGFTWSESK